MQQILSFLIKNSHRLLFLTLLSIALGFTIQAHDYHRSKWITSANFFSGGIYQQMSDVQAYFHLADQNKALAQENARLKALLFNKPDSLPNVPWDSLHGVKKTDILVAKVIHNSYNRHENFLTINAGAASGIKADMGVVNDKGIVGIVENTSKNYATIISILNTKSQINAKIKKSNHFGSLVWDGKNTGFVQLIDVPRLASVRKGDTIVTGGQSMIFPENIGIGTIEKVYIDKETNYFTLSVRLFNDMTNLGYVYIIRNHDRKEVLQLEEQTKPEHE